MLHEFAVEPAALSKWGSLWQALEQFGTSHGRMISRFPKRWERMVYEATANCPDAERKSLEVRLQQLKQKLMPSSRAFDANVGWRANAITQQSIAPFRGIIQSDNSDQLPCVLTPVDLHESNALWRVQTPCKFPRTPHDLAACISALCSVSRELLFVDPYFSAKREFTEVFEQFMLRAHENGRTFQRIEIHTGAKVPATTLEQESKTWLAPRIVSGVKVSFFLWQEREIGERLHRRYLLTDQGGIWFEGGLDSGPPGETTDVGLLSSDLRSERWDQYQQATAAFDPAGRFQIVGTRT